MRLYARYFMIHVKRQMEYRVSFLALFLTAMLMPVCGAAYQFLLFDRFDSLMGWSLYEVLLCFSLVQFGFGFGQMFGRGFDVFARQIRTGSFDTIMVRPRSTLLQVLGSDVEITRSSRLLTSLFFLWLSLRQLEVSWTALRILALVLSFVGISAAFFGLFMLQAVLCFWTVDGLEIMNIFTDGGRELAQYPIAIYHKFFVFVFTFIAPLAAANYYPVLYILGKTDTQNIAYALSPLLGLLFLLPCALIWKIGVRHYHSTGS